MAVDADQIETRQRSGVAVNGKSSVAGDTKFVLFKTS